MAKILIVDDDPGIQTMLRTLLKASGHETVIAEDGLKALESVKHNAFDLIITDLRMPNMDGMNLLRAVRAAAPSIPVILVTAYASRETAAEAVTLGAAAYVAKPFDIKDLMAAVARALNADTVTAPATDQTRGQRP